MKFRTEIERLRSPFLISHDDKIAMLGSCFSDNVGMRLERDGFTVTHNPLGPLYNPVSLCRLISDLLDAKYYDERDFIRDNAGIFHCLDFASRYQHPVAQTLADILNADFSSLRSALMESSVVALTLGSSVVYSLDRDIASTVGNCHKFPSSMFSRQVLSVSQIESCMDSVIRRLSDMGKKIILTVSPIRHLADGLHGNELSKARLLLACENLSDHAVYFPAYEIMIDDLRDYRFYDRDMKHPSDVACDYIYDCFCDTFFSPSTIQHAIKARGLYLRAAHRPIIQ